MRLMGRGLCIDVSAYPPDTGITTDMIAAWEQAHGEIRARDIVLFRTDYDREWRCRSDHKTVLSDWSGLLVGGRPIYWLKGSGYRLRRHVAGFLIDHDYPAQRPILGSDNLIMENLSNLYQVPAIFTFIAMPLHIKGLRVIGQSDSAGSKRLTNNTLMAESSRRFVAEV